MAGSAAGEGSGRGGQADSVGGISCKSLFLGRKIFVSRYFWIGEIDVSPYFTLEVIVR